MLKLLAATPNWWDTPGYSCLRQVSMDTIKDVDLDVLQAAINLSHRDKFLRDRASHRVAMKRLYQRHPVSTLCQEGVSKCSNMMGATFILFLILYRIYSKRTQAQTARINIHNRAAMVHAVKFHKPKADYDTAKGCAVAPLRYKTDHESKVAVVACYEACWSSKVMDTTTDSALCCREAVVMTEGGGMYLLAIIRQHLLMSGDVEVNPGPLDALDLRSITNELGSVIDKWFQIGVQLGISEAKLCQIESNHRTVERCFTEVINFWLNGNTQVGVSWKLIIDTLESQFVDEKGLAKKIREKGGMVVDNGIVPPLITGNQSATIEGSNQSAQKVETNMGQLTSSVTSEVMGGAVGSSRRVAKKRQGHRRKKKTMKRMNTVLENQVMDGEPGRSQGEAKKQQKHKKRKMDAIVEKKEKGLETKKRKVERQIASEESIVTDVVFNKPRLTFPVLDQKKMTNEEKERLEQRLYDESVSMMYKFQKLFSATVKSLKERNVTVNELSNHIGCLHALKPAFKYSKRGCLGSELPKADNIDDIMKIVRDYSSFFNYNMLENIIENLGGEQDRTNLANYLEEFAEYAERKVFECPRELGTMNEDGCANVFVTLDESYDDCTISSLNSFKRDLQSILKIPSDVVMTLCRLEPGSLRLTFQIPLFMQQSIFPLSDDQEAVLTKRGVMQLSCGNYQFTKQEAGCKGKDTSDERDSEEDSDIERQSMMVSTGMSVVGQFANKGSGGASSADSAIGTWTRQSVTTRGSVIGVSQFSEDIVLRDLRDEPYLRMEVEAAKLRSPDDSSGLELHQASYRGEIDKVKQLVESQHVNPLLKDKYGDTALHYAAIGGDLSIMKYFIEEQGLSLACQGQYGRTVLHHAAECKHLELVKYLVVEQQVDPLCKDDVGYTSLHTACSGGDMEIIQFLMNESLKYMSLEDVINERGKDVATPFHKAAFHGHLPVVKFFITELNFDPNTPGFIGRPALHSAAQQGHLEVVSYLIEETKCDPSCCPGEYKETPLHRAAQNGRLDVVRYLTQKHHCNPLSRNSHGNTPLHNAALRGHFKVVEFLISELNCDPNTPGQWGVRPLHCACQAGSMDIVKYLIEQMNCNASQLDERQVTPLHMAAMYGHLHIVKYLIQDKLCNPLCRDRVRNTPLHVAAQKGHLEVVQYYIQSIRSSPNIRGWHNMTPLERARSNGHTHVVNYLESLSTV